MTRHVTLHITADDMHVTGDDMNETFGSHACDVV